jgi:hypothetical protein
VVPAAPAERAKYEAAFQRFCSIFPDAFYISERGRDYVGKPKGEQEKGRLLSAGFHSMMGYFRDDGPLVELILDDSQQQELDRLWQELDFSLPLRSDNTPASCGSNELSRDTFARRNLISRALKIKTSPVRRKSCDCRESISTRLFASEGMKLDSRPSTTTSRK